MAYINPDDFPKTSNVGTAGQVLTSNGVGVPASFQDASGGGGWDANNPWYKDDFFGGQTSSGLIGELNWNFTASTSTLTYVGTEPRLGVFAITLGTGSTSRGAVFIQSGLNTWQFGLGQVTYKTSIRLSQLSDGTDTYKSYIGFYDDTAMSASGEGIYFTYTHSENSGNWTLNTSTANGVNTTLDSGVAATTNYVELGFVCNAASTSVEFFIDGVSVGTISATMPGSTDLTTAFYGAVKSAGSGQPILYVDVFYTECNLTTPRFA